MFFALNLLKTAFSFSETKTLKETLKVYLICTKLTRFTLDTKLTRFTLNTKLIWLAFYLL